MKTNITVYQIAVLTGAFLAGALLDNLLLHQTAAPSRAVTLQGKVAESSESAAEPNSSNSDISPVLAETESAEPAAGAPQKSLEAILAVNDPAQRTRDLQAYVNALSPAEFADALKRIRQMTATNERELASRLLIARWVQTDPDGALQFAAANHGFEYVAEDVFQQRAATDFQSALNRAREIPGSELRYRALRGVLSFKADTDPAGAIQLAQTLGDFRGSEPLTNVIYRQWATTDPQAAALFATQQGQNGESWRWPIMQVVNTWARQDPTAAANWSLSLPDADAQTRALSMVMRDWGRQDPTASANWIHSLPTGAQRDTAVAGLAQSIAYADPQNALGWIATMTDEAARQRALQRISREVMARDPQNGVALLQAAGLPANQINQQPPRGDRGR